MACDTVKNIFKVTASPLPSAKELRRRAIQVSMRADNMYNDMYQTAIKKMEKVGKFKEDDPRFKEHLNYYMAQDPNYYKWGELDNLAGELRTQYHIYEVEERLSKPVDSIIK